MTSSIARRLGRGSWVSRAQLAWTLAAVSGSQRQQPLRGTGAPRRIVSRQDISSRPASAETTFWSAKDNLVVFVDLVT
jgi:hypothetical protein